MTLFRQHRGTLRESMETVADIADASELLALARSLFPGKWEDAALMQEPYGDDTRIGWKQTQIVSIEGRGVLGISNGPIAGLRVCPIMCTCPCHNPGVQVRHCEPCCSRTYEKRPA